MQREDEKQFKDILKGVAEIINQKYNISPMVLGLWLESMRPYDIGKISSAFSKYINTPDKCRFMPKPGDIVEIIDGGGKDNAFLAWSKVERAISSVGSYETVVFDDHITHLVIKDMGGWIFICQGKEDELKFRGNEFKTRYQAYKGKSSLPAHPPKLYGLCESENSGKELEFTQDPVLIGDHAKAQLVLESGKNKKNLELSGPGPLQKLVTTKKI